MSERLEQIKKLAADLPPQFPDKYEVKNTPPFCCINAMRILRERAPGLDGNALSAALDAMANRYAETGSYDTTPGVASPVQQIMRRQHGRQLAVKREARQELQALGYRARYASAAEVLSLLTTAQDVALDDKRPSGRAILREQVGEKGAARLATTKSRHVKNAMEKLAYHPTAKLMGAQGMRTARDVSEIGKATLAGGVAALYQRADVAKRLAQQEAALADLRVRMEAAEAKLAEHDARLSTVEAGTDWKTAAVRLKAEGLNAGEVARRLGQKYETVRKHLQRNG